jgi:hypothetical protein
MICNNWQEDKESGISCIENKSRIGCLTNKIANPQTRAFNHQDRGLRRIRN